MRNINRLGTLLDIYSEEDRHCLLEVLGGIVSDFVGLRGISVVKG